MPSVNKANGKQGAEAAAPVVNRGAPREKAYTLSALVARLGGATEEEARLEIEGKSDAALVDAGRHVGTPRLCKELARNYGTFADWLPQATDDQRELCVFIDADWLRLAVWTGRQAETRYESQQLGLEGGAAGKQVREAEATHLIGEGKRARGILESGLTHLAGGDAMWMTKIQSALASSATAVPLSDSIRAMTDVAKEMLADSSPGMVARRKRSKLTLSAIDGYRRLADEVGAAVKAADAVQVRGVVTQSDVDLWDGIALSYFDQFVDTIDQARQVDPRIPAPTIIGLRSRFRRASRSKTKPSEPDADADAEPSEPNEEVDEAVG